VDGDLRAPLVFEPKTRPAAYAKPSASQ